MSVFPVPTSPRKSGLFLMQRSVHLSKRERLGRRAASFQNL